MTNDQLAREVLSKQYGNINELMGELYFTPQEVRGRAFELLNNFKLTHWTPGLNIEKIWDTHEGIPPDVRERFGLRSGDRDGFDRLARTTNGKYIAIQDKYHQDPDEPISVDNCRGLVAGMWRSQEVGWTPFDMGIVCTTAKTFSRNNDYPITFHLYDEYAGLDELFFMSLASWVQGKEFKTREPFVPRDYQAIAVTSAVTDLRAYGRSQVRMPCRTGKTFVQELVLEEMDQKVNIVMVPRLALIDQQIKHYSAELRARRMKLGFVAVCSADNLVEDDDERRNLSVPTMTDPGEAAEACQRHLDQGEGVVIFSTYASSQTAIDTAKVMGVTTGLIIFDESHNATGGENKRSTLMVRELPEFKKVFFTATPRENKRNRPGVIGHDNECHYGPVSYKMTFLEAINRGLITDFMVHIIATGDEHVRQLCEDREFVVPKEWNNPTHAGQLVAAAGNAEFMRRHTDIKHVLNFARSNQRSSDFLMMLGHLTDAETVFFSGEDKTSTRRDKLAKFFSTKKAIASNVNLFAEGLDTPAIDAVTYSDPVRSKIKVVQSLSRALTPDKSRPDKVAHFLCPIEVDMNGEPTVDSYDRLFEMFVALKEIDPDIADDVRAMSGLGPITQARKPRVDVEIVGMKIDLAEFTKRVMTKVWFNPGVKVMFTEDERLAFCRKHDKGNVNARIELRRLHKLSGGMFNTFSDYCCLPGYIGRTFHAKLCKNGLFTDIERIQFCRKHDSGLLASVEIKRLYKLANGKLSRKNLSCCLEAYIGRAIHSNMCKDKRFTEKQRIEFCRKNDSGLDAGDEMNRLINLSGGKFPFFKGQNCCKSIYIGRNEHSKLCEKFRFSDKERIEFCRKNDSGLLASLEHKRLMKISGNRVGNKITTCCSPIFIGRTEHTRMCKENYFSANERIEFCRKNDSGSDLKSELNRLMKLSCGKIRRKFDDCCAAAYIGRVEHGYQCKNKK